MTKAMPLSQTQIGNMGIEKNSSSIPSVKVSSKKSNIEGAQ
jgi:hypothetical protein